MVSQLIKKAHLIKSSNNNSFVVAQGSNYVKIWHILASPPPSPSSKWCSKKNIVSMTIILEKVFLRNAMV